MEAYLVTTKTKMYKIQQNRLLLQQDCVYYKYKQLTVNHNILADKHVQWVQLNDNSTMYYIKLEDETRLTSVNDVNNVYMY